MEALWNGWNGSELNDTVHDLLLLTSLYQTTRTLDFATPSTLPSHQAPWVLLNALALVVQNALI
jgi:hypothetical protein